MASISVEVDIEDFDDSEILAEVKRRNLDGEVVAEVVAGGGFPDDTYWPGRYEALLDHLEAILPPVLFEEVERWTNCPLVTQSEMVQWRSWAVGGKGTESQ